MEKTDEEINAAVAAACGWEIAEESQIKERAGTAAWLLTKGPWWRHAAEKTVATVDNLPDYCNDLNAMHEAEACVGARWATYCNTLLEIVEPEPRSLEVCHYWNLLHATARQRAEAFLRTMGKPAARADGKIDLWLEGFKIQEGHGRAEFVDTFEAQTLKEAVQKYAAQNKDPRIDVERMTCWCRRFFDNEREARSSFG